MEKGLYKISIGFVFTILLLPMFQYLINTFNVKPLQGTVSRVDNVQFNDTAWHNETYQKGKEKFLNQEFGFRNTLVRLNNEIYFRVFKLAKAKGVIVGKDNYLFEEGYIKDYYGMNFIGSDKINNVVNRLTKIDSVFKSMNKTLLVVFAPGKASYYPEYIPDNFIRVGEETNYKGYRKAIANSGINFIDFNEYFIAQKNKTKYVMYPKTGIHWSDYAAILSLDSINKKLAKIRNYNPVEIYWTEFVDKKDSVSVIDADIENGMNLLFRISKPIMKYPVLKFEEDGKSKPTVLNIGDSFYVNVFEKGIAAKVFNNAGFGFYFREIRSPFVQGGVQDIANVNLKEFIEKHDAVILMCTESTIYNFPFEFDAKLFNIYCTDLSDPVVYKQKLEEIKNNIRNSADWLKAVSDKAKASNIDVEQMINIDAEYILNHPN